MNLRDGTYSDAKVSLTEEYSEETEEDDENVRYRLEEEIADRIEELFEQSISGDLKGKSVEVGRLTDEGRAYLEQLSGIKMKDEVSFVLNPSDLMHMYRDHFGNNEKDKGNNIPLTIGDIREIGNIISHPERVIFGIEPDGLRRKLFYFLSSAEDGAYNLLEIYGDRKGNLTTKTFYKTRKAVSQRVLSLMKSEHLTSVTDGASLSDGAKLPKFFENPRIDEYDEGEIKDIKEIRDTKDNDDITDGADSNDRTNNRTNNRHDGDGEVRERVGYGAYSDSEVSLGNDPWSKAWGESIRTKRQQKQYAERERNRMRERVKSLSQTLGVDIEVLEDASALKGKMQRSKGWYDTKTGKITVVVSNHNSATDMEATVLHEAVAHHGLRELLGEHFDEFLDKVYEAAENGIKEQIGLLASRNGWNRRVATEEYLAGLAERTDFDRAEERVGGWFDKIKQFFIDMLFKAGFKHIRPGSIGDNELRYILWRSYQNLANPGRYRAFEWEAEDVTMQYELKVGAYAPDSSKVTEESVAETAELYELNERFNKELEKYEQGELPENHRFELGMPSPYLRSAGFPMLPISMRVSLLRKKSALNRHPFEASDLTNLVESIRKPIAIFKYTKENMRNLIVDVERDGKQFLVGVTLNYKANGIEVNSVSGLFPKGSIEWLKWIQDGKAIRIDQKGKVQAIIDSQRTTNTVESERIGLNLEDVAKIVEKFENPTMSDVHKEDGVRYRSVVNTATEAYEDAVVSTIAHRIDEGWHDYLRSVKKLQEAIENFSGRKLADHENVYLHALHKTSVDRAELDKAQRDYIDPLVAVLKKMLKKHQGLTQVDVERYMQCKHAPERNEYVARRDARREEEESKRKKNGKAVSFADAYARNRERDYSGLTALFDPTGIGKSVAQLEGEAARAVADFEAMVGPEDVAELWRSMKALTGAALEKQYVSGLIGKDVYEELQTRWEWYVPLRGFRAVTAGDVYEYVGREWTPELPVNKELGGRTSEAGDILATAMSMLNGAIVVGNKNAMKQKLLNLALKQDTELLSVTGQWYMKEPDGTWKPAYPPVADWMDGSEVRKTIEDFDEQMAALAKNGGAYRGRDGLSLPIRPGTKHQTEEHGIRVVRNGREYIVWVNGNPRAAQALNGLLNPDANQGGVLDWIENINRNISKCVTSYRPDFVGRNLVRDIQNATTIMSSVNGGDYAGRMLVNVKNLASPVKVRNDPGRGESIASLYWRYMNGKLDLTKNTDRMFDEFLRNGGETGYSQLLSPKGFQSSIEAAIKGKNPVTGVSAGVAHAVEWANRGVENLVRFAAYKTSRESGKSILRSIEDAKEASVNFNRKGSGAMGNRLARSLYLFVNPAVQGLCQYFSATKKSPMVMTGWVAFYVSIGAVMPVVATLISDLISGGGDGDDDEVCGGGGYFALQPYKRRGNVCIPLGRDNWFTIPLSQEQSMLYGIGETLSTHLMLGRGGRENLGSALITEFSKLQPVNLIDGEVADFTSGESAGKILFMNSIPAAVGYFTDAFVFDQDFTGRQISMANEYNEHLPEWRRGHDDDLLRPVSRELNRISGGSDSRRGYLDFNPSKWGYMLSRPFGGLVETPVKIAKSVMALRDEDYRAYRNYPVVGSFMTDAGGYAARNRMLIEEVKWWENQKKVLQDQVKVSRAGGIFEEAQMISDMLVSGELNQLEYMGRKDEDYGKQPLNVIKDLNRQRWDAITTKDKIKQAEIEEKLVEYQKRFVRKLHSFEAVTAEEKKAMLEDDYWEVPEKKSSR